MSALPTAPTTPGTGGPRPAGEDASGLAGWSAFELEGELVHVAPVPALARLVGADDRVADRMEVAGGVPCRRVVAAAHVAALLADAEVDPVPAAQGQAVFASPR